MNQPAPSRPPIRLAMVITELAVGGAERNFVRLAVGLDPTEFEIRVYSLKPPPLAPHDGLLQQLAAAQASVDFLNVRRAWQIPWAVRRLRREWSGWRPDIVQSFLFHANAVAVWSRGANVGQLVWGARVADPNARRQWLERRLVQRVDHVVCVSESVRHFARQAWNMAETKLSVIPNGVDAAAHRDLTPLPVSELGLQPGRRLLLCVGRLHEQKGFDWLLELAPRMLAELPDHDLVFVGEGPQRTQLQNQALRTPVADRIHFAGFRTDIPRCLAAAELLLLPSRWEGMPNVVLEAMASGLPVVATASEGVAEALGPMASQQMVPGNSPSAFLAKVVEICRSPETAAGIAEGNRRHLQNHFSDAAMLASYQQLYRMLARR